jgi:single-strand DNA-binding protein
LNYCKNNYHLLLYSPQIFLELMKFHQKYFLMIMNKVILMGRLVRDPDIRYSQGERQMAVARYSLAVNRTFRRDGDPEADFINCVAFGRQAEFTERYLKKGMRMLVTGRIQTGSYTNRDGARVYTTDVIVEDQEFAESKNASSAPMGAPQSASYAPDRPAPASAAAATSDGFINIPDGVEDEGLPFN